VSQPALLPNDASSGTGCCPSVARDSGARDSVSPELRAAAHRTQLLLAVGITMTGLLTNARRRFAALPVAPTAASADAAAALAQACDAADRPQRAAACALPC
jgi:hypothetical protein